MIPTTLPCPGWTLHTHRRAPTDASKGRSAAEWITVAAAMGIVYARPLPFLNHPAERDGATSCLLPSRVSEMPRSSTGRSRVRHAGTTRWQRAG